MGTEAAPIQADSSVVTAEPFVYCQQYDYDLDAKVEKGDDGACTTYARRGGSERSMTTGLTAVMTSISAMHQKAARALFRFRKSGAAG